VKRVLPRWAAAVAVVLLAGCLQGAPHAPGPGTDTHSGAPSSSSAPPLVAVPAPPVVDLLLGFALEGCHGLSILSPQPLDQVQALLPAGFHAAAPFGAPGLGAVGIDLYACGNLTTATARLPVSVYGQLAIPIERPAARVPQAPEAASQEYVVRVLAGTDVLAALWPAAGYDTRNGSAQVHVGPLAGGAPDPGLRAGNGSVGPDYYALATGSMGPASVPNPDTFARYTALADGSVLVWTGRYEFSPPAGGQGVFEVAPDDRFAAFGHPELAGLARLFDDGAMTGMDLRRVFTAPAA